MLLASEPDVAARKEALVAILRDDSARKGVILNIWIINHYALPPSLGGLNRHYYFSKYLQQMGHTVRMFTASAIHNTDINMIEDGAAYVEKIVDDIEYTYVRTSSYQGNGLSRIRNMLEFPLRLGKVCRKFPKPDVIYTSSPSPFVAAASLRIAKKLGVPCIVEIRDLWPESIVAYQNRSRKKPAILALYQLEKWIYKKADRLIFTMEGGKDYIRERGWEKDVDLNKIRHINNGVDLEEFDHNVATYTLDDPDLNNPDTFKIVYAGSIRAVNNLLPVMESAKILQENGQKRIQLLIYGAGNELTLLRQFQQENQLKNVSIKGHVNKKYIPFILSRADLNLIHVAQSPITRFGVSLNKTFDYLASGKPILSDLSCNYDLVERYRCGKTISVQTPDAIATAMTEMESLADETYNLFCANARCTAEDHDYKKLTDQLIAVLGELAP